MGRSFALNLTEKLLKYPFEDESTASFLTVSQARFIFSKTKFEIPDTFAQLVLNAGFLEKDFNPFGDAWDSEKQRESVVASIHPYLTKSESALLKGSMGTSWALKKEYIFHSRIKSCLGNP